MNLQSRKLRVWLISMGVIFAIFLFYNLISRTPPIEIDTGDISTDSNAAAFDSKIGKIGSVGVGTIQKARYTHLNERKQVDREFGFEKLLHAQGNEWEIEKPYMNVFQGNIKCYMTADKGTVQIEDAVGKATPKDATLTGNVVIHILPGKGSKIKEGFIYLDDIVFISEQSLFSSPGPIKLISEDTQMSGKGLEIVYNEGLDRLEYLKILTLESLRIRQSSKASLFAPETESPAGTSSTEQLEQQKTKEMPVADKETIEKNKGSYYKCVFRKNVVIDSPEQLVLADEVSIDNIRWSKNSDVNSENKAPGGTIAAEVTEESVSSPQDKTVESPEQFTDIVVTCDDGIIVVPMDYPTSPESAATNGKSLKSFNDQKGRPTFIAQKIGYCVITNDTVARGPSELTFYANDVMGNKDSPRPSEKDTDKQPVPVKVMSQEKAAFLPASNQVVFEGNVLCTMLRSLRPSAGKNKGKAEEKADLKQKYSLSSPKLTVDLSKDKQSQVDIKHITANGEVVQLDTSKWMGEQLLGFTKLKCLQFDYDVDQQMFLATGSGIIAVDNSKIIEPVKKTGRFSMQKPCYVVVRNFDTLKYLKEANRITADAGTEQILIDYFPVIKGQKDQQTTATANHIEAVLYETANGQTDLSMLNAKGGITYEEKKLKKGTTVQFVGSEMLYDGGKSMITAWGDELQPCFLNGALAPGIEYNLKTDRIKTKIIGPGMLQVGN